MTNPWVRKHTYIPRPTTLLCSVCHKWLPDDHYLERPSKTTRRGRGTSCTLCLQRRRDRYSGGASPRVIDLSDELPPRPPEMQGAGVSVFTPWVSKVRA